MNTSKRYRLNADDAKKIAKDAAVAAAVAVLAYLGTEVVPNIDAEGHGAMLAAVASFAVPTLLRWLRDGQAGEK